MNSQTEWLEMEILTGLQKLACLSLDRTPAAEMLVGTAAAWTEALTADRSWDESRDAPRVRSAFVTLAKTCRRWPAPVEFTEALPSSAQLALVRESRVASAEVRASNIRRIAAMLDGTYTDRKRAAGGDQ